VQNYKNLLWLSQVTMALCTKTQTEHYRRSKTEIDSNGHGRTMGTLYWMFANIWQGPSRASIEYGGRWKVLHYYAAKFYTPVLGSGYISGGNFTVYAVSDLQRDLSKPILALNVVSWKMGIVKSFNHTFSLKASVGLPIFSLRITDILSNTNCDNSTCFLTYSLIESGITVSDNFLLLQSPKHLTAWQNPSLSIGTVSSAGMREFKVQVKAKAVAAFVWLETRFSGRFSDNGFMLTENLKELRFYAWEDVTVADLQTSLSVWSLFDIYQ